MKRVATILIVFVLSIAAIASASAQLSYKTWTVSVTLRYNKKYHEKQDLESTLYGITPGDVLNKEFLVSARTREEAEIFGHEAASKVPGGKDYLYEGTGEFKGRPCHIYVVAEIENLTVEAEAIEPTEDISF